MGLLTFIACLFYHSSSFVLKLESCNNLHVQKHRRPREQNEAHWLHSSA